MLQQGDAPSHIFRNTACYLKPRNVQFSEPNISPPNGSGLESASLCHLGCRSAIGNWNNQSLLHGRNRHDRHDHWSTRASVNGVATMLVDCCMEYIYSVTEWLVDTSNTKCWCSVAVLFCFIVGVFFVFWLGKTTQTVAIHCVLLCHLLSLARWCHFIFENWFK